MPFTERSGGEARLCAIKMSDSLGDAIARVQRPAAPNNQHIAIAAAFSFSTLLFNVVSSFASVNHIVISEIRFPAASAQLRKQQRLFLIASDTRPQSFLTDFISRYESFISSLLRTYVRDTATAFPCSNTLGGVMLFPPRPPPPPPLKIPFSPLWRKKENLYVSSCSNNVRAAPLIASPESI